MDITKKHRENVIISRTWWGEAEEFTAHKVNIAACMEYFIIGVLNSRTWAKSYEDDNNNGGHANPTAVEISGSGENITFNT